MITLKMETGTIDRVTRCQWLMRRNYDLLKNRFCNYWLPRQSGKITVTLLRGQECVSGGRMMISRPTAAALDDDTLPHHQHTSNNTIIPLSVKQSKPLFKAFLLLQMSYIYNGHCRDSQSSPRT